MAILLLHRTSGQITLKPGSVDDYAADHGLDTVPDGDLCVKLLRGDD